MEKDDDDNDDDDDVVNIVTVFRFVTYVILCYLR